MMKRTTQSSAFKSINRNKQTLSLALSLSLSLSIYIYIYILEDISLNIKKSPKTELTELSLSSAGKWKWLIKEKYWHLRKLQKRKW